MAQGSKEHRMVFDIRGRRRHVVKVVYAILAILMALSLFLVTGAVNLNSIFGTATSAESAAANFEKQAKNIEAKLAKTPEDETLLASLTRTRINTANAMITNGAGSSQAGVEEVKQQLALSSEDWSEYLKATSEPNGTLASQVAPAIFQLAELSSSSEEALENIKVAAEAQKVSSEVRPNLNTLSTLAFYELFAQNYKAAAVAKEEAAKLATNKFERETFENKFEEVEKSAKKFGKQVKAEQVTKSKTAGKEKLENPLQGLSGTGGTGLTGP